MELPQNTAIPSTTKSVKDQEKPPRRIVMAIPGEQIYQQTFLSVMNSVGYLGQKNVQLHVSVGYDPNIYHARSRVLGADSRKGKDQAPFQGKVDYDYIMWVDSDIVFPPESLYRLMKRDVDIVSGVYPMDLERYAVVKSMNDAYFAKHGSFEFLTANEVKEMNVEYPGQLVEVDYVGMGFMLVKKGVMESLDYPWFSPVTRNIQTSHGVITELASEDASFCHRVKEKGFKVHIDPSVVVNHIRRFTI